MSSDRVLVAGIEGGATQTIAVVIDAHTGEAVLSAPVSGMASNQFLVGIDACAHVMVQLLRQCKEQCGVPADQPLAAVGLCLSGIDREEEKAHLESAIRALDATVAAQFIIRNDAFAPLSMLAPITGAGASIVLISGTGSIGMMRLAGESDQTQRTGGWGHLIGDEGSAYAVASRALKRIFRAMDRAVACDATRLHDRMLAHFGIAKREQMLDPLYRSFTKSHIASFCKCVAEEAFGGDQLAVEIFERTGRQLGRMLVSLLRRIKVEDWSTQFPAHRISVACVGSVWRSFQLLESGLATELNEQLAHLAPFSVALFRPTSPCAFGSAFLAADALLSSPVPADVAAQYLEPLAEITVTGK